MCLYTQDANWNIADRDITCYKVMYVKDRKIFSPFRDMVYVMDLEYKAEGFFETRVETEICKNRFTVIPAFEKAWIMHNGFHSYIHLQSAFLVACDFNDTCMQKNYILVKCVIPKGTRYCKGSSSNTLDRIDEYCSEKIKVVAWSHIISRNKHSEWHTQLDNKYDDFIKSIRKRIEKYYDGSEIKYNY